MSKNILETMAAELVEGVALLRQYYPNDNGKLMLGHAMFWRPWRYQHGRWPTVKDIWPAEQTGEEAAEEKARKPEVDAAAALA